MAGFLTTKQLQAIKSAFDSYDDRGNRQIEVGNLENVLKELGQSPSESMIDEINQRAHKREGGVYIDLAEFLIVMCDFIEQDTTDQRRVTKHQLQEYRQAFSSFDSDDSGEIDRTELRNLLIKLRQKSNEARVEQIMKSSDLDGNGSIDFYEFLLAMCIKSR